MRIALIIERFEAARGGREKSTAQIASALSRRGHDVTVLCQRGSAGDASLDVRALGSRGLLRASRLTNFVSAVRDLVEQEAFDIVHATLPVPGCNVFQPRGGTVPAQVAAGLRRRGLLGQALAASAGPFRLHRKRMAELERQVVVDPNVLCLAVSELVAEEFATFYDRRDGVRVVYNGVDVPDPAMPERAEWRQELRYRLGVGADDPVFLTVATNFELKGVAESIVAFARWVDSLRGRITPRLLVVGRYRPEGYERVAGLRSVGRLIQFIEPTEEIFKYYAAADACVLLSWYDPCSRVVLEAARWGIPSMTTTYNGAAEVLARGAGIVVDSPRNIAAVVAGFDELADPARRAERARNCLEIADELSTDRHVDQLIEVYEEVAGQP